MQRLILENKTGFSSLLPFRIVDKNNILFYSSDFVKTISKGEILKFNLPAGIYFYDGILTRLKNPVEYKNIVLPKPERVFKKKPFKIIFGENPNKCSILWNKGIILFDTSFLKKPLFIKYNIYFHELGHHFYKTEKYCDLYAAKKMLEFGFNPSQVGLNSLDSLSNLQYERKKFIINHLSNIN